MCHMSFVIVINLDVVFRSVYVFLFDTNSKSFVLIVACTMHSKHLETAKNFVWSVS